MSDVILRLRVQGENIEILSQAGAKLGELGNQAKHTQGTLGGMNMSLTDLKSGFDIITGAIRQSTQMLSEFERAGAAGLKATDALNALTGGQAEHYVKSMSSQMKGLVNDFALTQSAVKALGLGIVDTAE